MRTDPDAVRVLCFGDSNTHGAPADDPEYLVAVTLDEPTTVTSSSANVPAFQKAMTQVLKTYRVMPATTAPTLLPKMSAASNRPVLSRLSTPFDAEAAEARLPNWPEPASHCRIA